MVANPARGQLNSKNCFFPCPRSPLRNWSREAGSTTLYCFSPLIFTLRLNLIGWCLLMGFLPLSAAASIYTVSHHGVSSELIGSRNCEPTAFHCQESTGTWPVVLKVVPVMSAAFSGFTMNLFFMRLPFPTSTIGN